MNKTKIAADGLKRIQSRVKYDTIHICISRNIC